MDNDIDVDDTAIGDRIERRVSLGNAIQSRDVSEEIQRILCLPKQRYRKLVITLEPNAFVKVEAEIIASREQDATNGRT